MKKWLFPFAIIIAMVIFPPILVADAASPSQLADTPDTGSEPLPLFSANELEWLKNSQPLNYVYDPDWAPFEWKNDIGSHTGIIADILNLISEKAGVELLAINTDTWQESVELVKRGKADMFSAITQNNERESYLNFTSKDIYSYPAVLITRFDDRTIYLDPAEDLKGKTVGIIKSSGLGEYIKERYPDLEYVELATTQDGFLAVENNKIDLFAINSVTGKYFIEKRGFNSLKIVLKLDYFYHLKIAVRNDLPSEIISIFDKSLKSISEEELNHIFNKWTAISIKKQTDWTLLFKVSAALLFTIAFLIWSNRKLNLIVATKTQELRDKNNELEKALAEIKALRGIIPICSYCHKIRDDEGLWNLLEAYISKHSDAEFSHGICPDCLQQMYKDSGIEK